MFYFPPRQSSSSTSCHSLGCQNEIWLDCLRPDKNLEFNEAKNFNFLRVSSEDLDCKLDFWLETSFDESQHDEYKAMSRDNVKVLSIYENSVKRVGNNYSVSLPFKSDNVIMPNSFDVPKRRILNLTKSLVKSPKTLDAYVKFMHQLFKDEHAIILTDEEVISKIRYLNHHLVHGSGKDRMVFSCSSKFQRISSNLMSLKGPTLENTPDCSFLAFSYF